MNSNRCKRKNMPRQSGEPVSVPVNTLKRKIKSRRFETKVMFLAVIGWPCTIMGRWFNGLVGIYEVCEQKKAETSSSTKLFCYNNDDQKNLDENWRDSCRDTMTPAELQDAIEENFNFDVDANKLQFRTRKTATKSKQEQGKKGDYYYLQPGNTIATSPYKNIDDWEVVVYRKKGTKFTKVSQSKQTNSLYPLL